MKPTFMEVIQSDTFIYGLLILTAIYCIAALHENWPLGALLFVYGITVGRRWRERQLVKEAS